MKRIWRTALLFTITVLVGWLLTACSTPGQPPVCVNSLKQQNQ